MRFHKYRLQDALFMLAILAAAFGVNLLLQNWFDTRTMIPMIFVLGVFLVSWQTQGYFWGIAASLISVLLVARIRAALRNARHMGMLSELPGGRFSAGDLEIDFDRRQVTAAGKTVHLTQTEYNILALLSRHTGKVLTYSAIIREIWGGMDDGSVKKLQVNMANIRKKLGCRPGDNRYFINELGVGYRMLDE